MKKPFLKISLFSLFLFLMTALALAQTPEEKGRKIMDQIDALPTFEKMMSETTLDIYDAQGKVLFSKKSRVANYAENFRDKDKRLKRTISYFYAPADDQGNSALMVENAGQDDDQWVYLKGLRKPKRIIGSDKSSTFMGSDFTNGDVGARNVDDSNYKWLATEDIQFKGKTLKVEKIEGQFKTEAMRKDYGHSKSVVWMHADSGLPFKMEMYNLNGQLERTLTLLAFVVQKNADGQKVFIPSSLEMKNVITGTKTVMAMENIKVEAEAAKVTPEIFQLDYLTRKWW